MATVKKTYSTKLKEKKLKQLEDSNKENEPSSAHSVLTDKDDFDQLFSSPLKQEVNFKPLSYWAQKVSELECQKKTKKATGRDLYELSESDDDDDDSSFEQERKKKKKKKKKGKRKVQRAQDPTGLGLYNFHRLFPKAKSDKTTSGPSTEGAMIREWMLRTQKQKQFMRGVHATSTPARAARASLQVDHNGSPLSPIPRLRDSSFASRYGTERESLPTSPSLTRDPSYCSPPSPTPVLRSACHDLSNPFPGFDVKDGTVVAATSPALFPTYLGSPFLGFDSRDLTRLERTMKVRDGGTSCHSDGGEWWSDVTESALRYALNSSVRAVALKRHVSASDLTCTQTEEPCLPFPCPTDEEAHSEPSTEHTDLQFVTLRRRRGRTRDTCSQGDATNPDTTAIELLKTVSVSEGSKPRLSAQRYALNSTVCPLKRHMSASDLTCTLTEQPDVEEALSEPSTEPTDLQFVTLRRRRGRTRDTGSQGDATNPNAAIELLKNVSVSEECKQRVSAVRGASKYFTVCDAAENEPPSIPDATAVELLKNVSLSAESKARRVSAVVDASGYFTAARCLATGTDLEDIDETFVPVFESTVCAARTTPKQDDAVFKAPAPALRRTTLQHRRQSRRSRRYLSRMQDTLPESCSAVSLSIINMTSAGHTMRLLAAPEADSAPGLFQSFVRDVTAASEITLAQDATLVGDLAHSKARQVVLARCGQEAPVPFDEHFNERTLRGCRKIGEGVYGEVFLHGETTVIKVIPIEGCEPVNGEPQKKFEEIISEIVIAMELTALRHGETHRTSGFSELRRCWCVEGRYPPVLLALWAEYDRRKGSENDSPAMFGPEQLYIVLELANGGQDLEAFVFNSAEQSLSILIQTAYSLAVAERALEFEHRDLHWGNLLIAKTKEKEVQFVLDGRVHAVATKGVEVAIIDYTLSRMTYDGCCIFNDLAMDPELFTSEGDFQFDVYRLMRTEVGNDWSQFKPRTNLLWVKYLLDKMVKLVRYRRVDTKVHKRNIEVLKELETRSLKCIDCSDFVTDVGERD